jgi:hypothetical protein
MNKIGHFNFFILCSGDMSTDLDHLHIKRIHLVSFSYIVIEDSTLNTFFCLAEATDYHILLKMKIK